MSQLLKIGPTTYIDPDAVIKISWSEVYNTERPLVVLRGNVHADAMNFAGDPKEKEAKVAALTQYINERRQAKWTLP